QDWCMKVLRHWCENARATILAEEDNSIDRAERPENGRDSSPARLGAVCFPQPCRKRTLLLVIHNNPFYVEQLESAERTTYRVVFSLAVRVLEHLGFTAMEIGGDYTVGDFVDHCHMSEQGGKRRGEEVAPKVLELAQRLGYTKEGNLP